ncbi:hypothetical protein HK407_01g01030 [Ordospora pajunii]|uniref:uncharacterized protein n=1 Tax=Ordospora pajunii TaxID=3039483 RepID=UPI0029528E57|nr:uncharacterized protein HK407_01g01030 [Ordospora pajunii]KAH9412210.1 hypothetical protein HK407_01g01030 [Ordospora pajunii]
MYFFGKKEDAMAYLRTKFVNAHDVNKIMVEYQISLKRGAYSSYEAKRIDDAIKAFLAENGLEMKNLHGFFLEEEAEFPIRKLLLAVSEVLANRAMNSIWIYVSYHYHPYVDAKWEPENEIQLLNLVRALGFRWKEICGIMNKSSRKCIKNYYRIMGYEYLSSASFKIDEESIPTTESGWNEMCRKLKTNRKRLSHLINGYISRRLIVPLWNEYNNMMLIGYVLVYNHFCSMEIRLLELFELINNRCFEGVDGVDVCREDIAKQVDEYLPDASKYMLDVAIDVEDVFWRSIKVFVRFPSVHLRCRFIQIMKIHGIRVFGDLFSVFKVLAIDCCLYKIKDMLREEVSRIMNAKDRRCMAVKNDNMMHY